MSEQRIKILEMLSAGKITVDEAQKLLESVTNPGANSETGADEWKREKPFKPYEGIEDEEQTQEGLVIDLSNVELSGAVLGGANLKGAKLDGADLSGAVLSGANLENADLRGADLSGAVLDQANFRNADLRESDLSGSVLPRIDFEGVHHPSLKLSGVILSAGYTFRDNKLYPPKHTEDLGHPAPPKMVVNEDGSKIVMLSHNDGPVLATIKAKPEPKPAPNAAGPPPPPTPPSP